MRKFRAQVTLLVMTATILISILSILATVSVERSSPTPPVKFVYRLNTPKSDSVDKTTPPAQDLISIVMPFQPDPLTILSFATLIAASAAVVATIIGNMLVKPLETLQHAIESVNPEAFIPKLSEEGDGSTLITVRLLNTLSDTLKKAMDSRMRLVAAAGHDMRTPLTRMRLRAEMIKDDTVRDKWINDIDEMMHIADSAITLVKEDAGQQERETVRLDELLEDLVAELDMIGHAVRVDHLDQTSVDCSPNALKRALSNLLVNACTHGSEASVSLSNDGENAFVVITDEGPGIPEDVISHAFEPFFRAEPARGKKVPGAGLGLAIVKDIVTKQGGRITLANRKPTGLYQEVVLPLSGTANEQETHKMQSIDRKAFNQGVKDVLTLRPLRQLLSGLFSKIARNR